MSLCYSLHSHWPYHQYQPLLLGVGDLVKRFSPYHHNQKRNTECLVSDGGVVVSRGRYGGLSTNMARQQIQPHLPVCTGYSSYQEVASIFPFPLLLGLDQQDITKWCHVTSRPQSGALWLPFFPLRTKCDTKKFDHPAGERGHWKIAGPWRMRDSQGERVQLCHSQHQPRSILSPSQAAPAEISCT